MAERQPHKLLAVGSSPTAPTSKIGGFMQFSPLTPVRVTGTHLAGNEGIVVGEPSTRKLNAGHIPVWLLSTLFNYSEWSQGTSSMEGAIWFKPEDLEVI